MHRGFKDLRPVYDQKKFKRAKDLANHWEFQLGEKIGFMVQKQARKNFIQHIEAGHKLTFKDIQCLNSILKKDYVK